MRKLLITTALVGAMTLGMAKPASAGFLVGAVASLLSVSAATAAIIVNIAASVVLSLVSAALQPKPKQSQLKRELAQPNSRPPYRFVYGRDRVYGSPAPWRVKNRNLYGCLILNSRPSKGDIDIFVDKRATQVTGGDSILDFALGGARIEAVESEQGFGNDTRVWLGLGDQAGPPDQIVSEVPEFFEATDGWQGLTVLWVKMNAGRNKNRQKRWPRVPPEIEVEGDWSLVWDPREAGQDPDDPATWAWSDNQALCLLDALRRNPIRRYRLDLLDIESFKDAADIADQMVDRYYPVGAGNPGPEKRYTANGLIAWQGGEMLDQLSPLVEAGAGQLVRTGSKIAYAPGAWRTPIYTMTDILEEGGVDYQVLRPGRELPRAVKASYISPKRDWQEAELPILEVPGADSPVGDDGVQEIKLSLVTSPTQAMRIQKIEAMRFSAQKRLSVTLPPDAMELVGGANLTAAMPAGFTRLDGHWQVDSINPGLWASDIEGGVSLRLPTVLRETAEAHFAWTPSDDEFEIIEKIFDPTRAGIQPPGPITVWTGAEGARDGGAGPLGGTTKIPGIRFAFDPSETETVDAYEWEWRGPEPDSTGLPAQPHVWEAGGIIPEDTRDGDGQVPGHLYPVAVGDLHEIRVRAVKGGSGFGGLGGAVETSEWFTISDVLALAPEIDLAAPENGQATGGAGEIIVSFKAPNSGDFEGIEFWAADVDDIGEAGVLEGPIAGSANAVFEVTETGLGGGETRYYWARSVGPYGATSPFTSSVSATTEQVIASGGTITDITEDGVDWRVHTFTANGMFTVTQGGTVEYRVVGPGGGGGAASTAAGGGGGGGEVLVGDAALEAASYPVVVGPGGAGGESSGVFQGSDGGAASTFNGQSAAPGGGGGGAASFNSSENLGRPGAAGGGGGARGPDSLFGGLGSPNGDGGDGYDPSSASERAGGGGGGAEEDGQTASANSGGGGGAGADGYGGGGGGGTRTGAAGDGADGGGNGGMDADGQNASSNSGGGGGGAGASSGSSEGGDGADGAVIIRYRT